MNNDGTVNINDIVDNRLATEYGLTTSTSSGGYIVSNQPLKVTSSMQTSEGEPYLHVPVEIEESFFTLTCGAKVVVEQRLIEMYQSPSPVVRRIVAVHQHTPLAILILMQDDTDYEVRNLVGLRIKEAEDGTD